MEEIWCENRDGKSYGVACILSGEGSFPLVSFSHELGDNREYGVR